VLIPPSPSNADDAAPSHTIIVHIAPPFELKPEAPPLPAILRVVAAPGDAAVLEGDAAGVWSEHTGSYAENFRSRKRFFFFALYLTSMLLKQVAAQAASARSGCHH
jgi:hypothetical protein